MLKSEYLSLFADSMFYRFFSIDHRFPRFYSQPFNAARVFAWQIMTIKLRTLKSMHTLLHVFLFFLFFQIRMHVKGRKNYCA